MGWIFGHKKDRMPAPIPVPAPKPAPPPVPAPVVIPRIRLGMNVHNLTPDALDACRRYHVTQLRTTVYGASWFDPTSGKDYQRRVMAEISRAGASPYAMRVLVVIHTGNPFAWGEIVAALNGLAAVDAFQLGNENDAPGEAHIEPEVYAAAFLRAREAAPGAFLVAAAAGPDVAYFARALFNAGLTPGALAVHAYGPPADAALVERVSVLRSYASAWYGLPVWCTEAGYGYASGRAQGVEPTLAPSEWERRQLESVVSIAERAVGLVERCYLYELGEGADSEGYGVRRSDGLERPAALWLASENGLPAGESWDTNGGLPREDAA